MNLLALVGLISAVFATSLGGFSLMKGRKRIHFVWSAFIFTVAIWSFGIYKFSTSSTEISSVFWWRVAEAGVILMPAFLTHFILEFLAIAKRKLSIFFLLVVYLTTLFYLFINVFTDLFFGPVRLAFEKIYYITPTVYYSSFVAIMFLGLVSLDIFILLYKYKKEKLKEKKNQIKYLILSFGIGFAGGSTSFLPVYGIDVYPVYNITIFIASLILTYNIFKFSLMGIKIFAVQIFLVALNLVAIINIFVPSDFSGFSSLFFLGIFFVSYLLKKSFDKEIKQKQELEQLTEKLRKANKELKKLDKVKSEFISIASHQLRTPITIIKGYVSMLLEGDYGKINEKANSTLKQTYKSAEHMAKLVESFLNISRIESGKIVFDFKKEKFDILVRETADSFGEIAKTKNLKINLNIQNNLPAILVDKVKIKEVVSNLIDNAIKYTQQGAVTVGLKLIEEKDKKFLLLSVADNGIGISKEDIDNIFKKFIRGKKVSLVYTEGLGLGLYFSKKVIEAHHGKIWVESEGENKGSRFIVELPINLDKLKEKKKQQKVQSREVRKFIKEI